MTADNAIAVRDESQLMTALRSSLYPGASDASIALVLAYCKSANLDPMMKPVHIVAMWDSKLGAMRDVIMPGVGKYRTDASRSGHAGTSKPKYGPMVTENIGGVDITYPEFCEVTVKRLLPSGVIAEFTAEEFWLENYAVKGGREKSIAPNAMWMKRPRGQLAKCAEAQALRKGFPEVGAQPTAEEMEGKAIEGDYTVVDEKHAVSQPREKPAATTQEINDAIDRGVKSPTADGGKPEPGIHGLSESQTRILVQCIKSARTTEAAVLEKYHRVDLSNLNTVLDDLRALRDVQQ